MGNDKNLISNGKATVDIDAFLSAVKGRSPFESFSVVESAFERTKFSRVDYNFYGSKWKHFSGRTQEQLEEERLESVEESGVRLREVGEYLVRFGLKFDYFGSVLVPLTRKDRELQRDGGDFSAIDLRVVGMGSQLFAILPEFVALELFESRESLTLGEIKKAIGSGEQAANGSELSAVGPQDNLTLAAARGAKELAEAQAADINEQLKAIKEGKHPGIEKIYAEMEAAKKKFELMVAELSGQMVNKKSSLMLDIESKMNTIEALDAALYAVRCFEGETVDFICIKDGKAAPVEEPVVVYQKMRIMDEELGRHCSIYELNFDKVKLFEDLLAAREDVVDIFCPNKKSVCFTKLSNRPRSYAVLDEVHGLFESHERLHAGKIGILIRDGEKLFYGWTDEERINIRDGKIVYSRGEIVYAAEDGKKNPWELDGELTESSWDLPEWFNKSKDISYSDRSALMGDPDDEQKKETFENYRQLTAAKAFKDSFVSQSISRIFAFSILDGVVKRGDMLRLPEGESISQAAGGKPSHYVLFSMADAWLPETTYPSFSEYIKKYCSTNKVGDPILTMIGISDGSYNSYSKRQEYVRGTNNYIAWTHDASIGRRSVERINLIRGGDVFVSAKKEWSRFGARANLRLRPSEYINLSFMNSVWLDYVLRSRSAGSVKVGNAEFGFGDLIPYINTAKQWLRGREKAASAVLEQLAPEILEKEDWPITMSMWMFENNVRMHEVTEYQMKRFAKYCGGESPRPDSITV